MGVASALSQGVPCVSTSWNHKYEMLFQEFNQEKCVVNSDDNIDLTINLIENQYNNLEMNILKLNKAKSNLENRINHMWNNIAKN